MRSHFTFPAQIRGFLYGVLITTSLVSVITYASGTDGVFGEYFERMTGYCLISGNNPSILTGLAGELDTGYDFGDRRCTSLKTLIGNMFSSTTAPAGQAIVGFSSTGEIIYSSIDSVPIGTISAFNSTTCPIGWIPADGTNGTPDLRGEFIRGWDNGRGVDNGRGLGSWQKATTITVDNGVDPAVQGMGIGSENSLDPNTDAMDVYWNLAGTVQTFNDSTYLGKVRPRNVALLYCIKNLGPTSSPSSNVTWTNTTGDGAGNIIQATTGNVGIGTNSPAQKLTVNGSILTNDICLLDGSCLSTAAQKTASSGAPVLYNLYNNSAWSNMDIQAIRDQWRYYQNVGCDLVGADYGWSAANIATCKANTDADIDAVIAYSYQPAILRAIGYVKRGGAPDAWLQGGCLSAPNIVLCTQGYACSYETYQPTIPAFLSVTCIGTP